MFLHLQTLESFCSVWWYFAVHDNHRQVNRYHPNRDKGGECYVLMELGLICLGHFTHSVLLLSNSGILRCCKNINNIFFAKNSATLLW